MTARFRGFTLIELVIALVVLGLVATVISRVFITQQRLTVSQVEQASMQANVRTGTLIVANELRELAAGSFSNGDLVSIGATGLTYRAMRSLALACRVTRDSIRVRVNPLFGARPITPNRDSMAIFVEGNPSTASDDRWTIVRITGIDSSSTCGGAPALALATRIDTIANPLSAFVLDAPVRTFEIMELGPVLAGGHNWLGARSVSAGESLTPVAGPITIAGLSFAYFDSLGNVTGIRSRVRSIRITLRGQTDWSVRPSVTNLPVQPLEDSLVTTVTLRNAPMP
jgi:prepilin-type N-terminal cleavage/methylation domain-containing protein